MSSATAKITREVSRTVTQTVTVPATIALVQKSNGSVDVTINGVLAVRFTASGYLRRFPGLPDSIGFRRTEDGRIAIKTAA